MRLRKKQKIESRHAKPVTGRSLSANSYYRPRSTSLSSIKKNDKKQEEAGDKKIKINFPGVSRLINWAIVVSFIVLFFFATTLSGTPNIKIVESGFKYRDLNDYEASATKLLNDSPFSRSKVFFRSQEFEQKMQVEYPEISNIEAIVPIGGRDLSVSMRLSSPLALVANGSDKGIVDDNGVLITKDTSKNSNLYTIRFTTPQENFDVGSRIFTNEEINQLELLAKEMSQLKIKVSDKDVSGLTIGEALFNVRDGQFEVKMNELPYIIKLSSYADSVEQVGAAKVTLLKLHNELNQPPTKYLDVRVPGRVFVL